MIEPCSNLPIPELKPAEFDMIRDLAYRSCGLDLRAGKERLVAVRLGKHIRAGGFRSFRDYLETVYADRTGNLLSKLIDSLTTNHTGFLREPAHFDYLRELLATEYRLRARMEIWSAASSTGEEPYSILFTAAASALERGFGPEMRVLGSDISTRALAEARTGLYPRERVSALPAGWVNRFFESNPDVPHGFVQVKAHTRELISFQRINLNESLPVSKLFPVIFCRNVMIYFNKKTQQMLVERLTGKLEPGGYLFVGHSESLSGIDHNLRYVRPAVYRKIA